MRCDIEINDVKIPFDPDWKNISISLSGGADSALLAYILCENANSHQTIHIISHIRCWKTKPWQQNDSKRIYQYLRNSFPHLKFVRHENFIAPDIEYAEIGPSIIDEYGKKVSGDNIQIRAFAEFVCFKHDIDVYFNAVTKNPNDSSIKGMKERDITENKTNSHLREMTHMNRLASHPFRFVMKDWILDQYKQKNLMELFNLTRSCEGVFDDINYENYTNQTTVPECGECFWCKEREWAIENAK